MEGGEEEASHSKTNLIMTAEKECRALLLSNEVVGNPPQGIDPTPLPTYYTCLPGVHGIRETCITVFRTAMTCNINRLMKTPGPISGQGAGDVTP